MEDQVTSLEMSKQLKEAGFEVDTPFAWMISVSGKDMVDAPITKRGHQLPCYTFQLLWEALPKGVTVPNKIIKSMQMYFKVMDMNYIMYWEDNLKQLKKWDISDSLPDTVAKAVLWCIKEGYIKLDKKK